MLAGGPGGRAQPHTELLLPQADLRPQVSGEAGPWRGPLAPSWPYQGFVQVSAPVRHFGKPAIPRRGTGPLPGAWGLELGREKTQFRTFHSPCSSRGSWGLVWVRCSGDPHTLLELQKWDH